VAKLAAIIPPPFANQVLYHGVLAPNAAWRREVVPKPPPPEKVHKRLSRGPGSPRWLAWSELLWRVFRVDGWRCPTCAGPLRLKGVIEGPPASTRILDALRKGPAPP
jgi:hypothetical protein